MSPEIIGSEALKKEFRFWIKVHHFEERYKSIDLLLKETGIKNILELSSGFSFRGLDYLEQDGVYYIDTDLPEIVKQKLELLNKLHDKELHWKGRLEILPLNALDKKSFRQVINRFPPGEVAIVNEGLLMYLDTVEKERLCSIIREILKERGGVWITSDIYIRKQLPDHAAGIDFNEQFFNEHGIENKKFDSFDAAKDFFSGCGFILDKEASGNNLNMISTRYLSEFRDELHNLRKQNREKNRATWRLKIDS